MDFMRVIGKCVPEAFFAPHINRKRFPIEEPYVRSTPEKYVQRKELLESLCIDVNPIRSGGLKWNEEKTFAEIRAHVITGHFAAAGLWEYERTVFDIELLETSGGKKEVKPLLDAIYVILAHEVKNPEESKQYLTNLIKMALYLIDRVDDPLDRLISLTNGQKVDLNPKPLTDYEKKELKIFRTMRRLYGPPNIKDSNEK